MEVLVKRDLFHDDCTLGNLTVNGTWLCYTLEPAFHEISGQPVSYWKIPGKTAIPVGRYKLTITYSEHFGKYLPQIMDIPGFDGVRLHSLNDPAQTEGCIGLGLHRGPDNETILQSREAMGLFQPQLQSALNNGEDCWITVG